MIKVAVVIIAIIIVALILMALACYKISGDCSKAEWEQEKKHGLQ